MLQRHLFNLYKNTEPRAQLTNENMFVFFFVSQTMFLSTVWIGAFLSWISSDKNF